MRRGDGIILSSVLLFFFIFFLLTVQAKDLYKVLGLEKGASQHDIKKAFRRLSLKYHPDKNPSKDAQAKFADISNAYDVLSDEEKRKNYDMYGDEHGRGFDSGGSHPGGFGSSQGQSHNGRRYTSERQSWGFQGGSPFGQDGFSSSSFGSGEGGSSFSFSFGGGSSFAESILENIFGSGGGFFGSNNRKDSGGNSNHNGRQASGSSIISASHLSSKDFGSKVLNQYYTWAVLFYPTSSAEVEEKVSVLEQVATGLRGSVKVGRVDCRSQVSLCKEEKLWPLKKAKLYFYSLGSTGKVRALEYVGDWSSKDIKDYCVEILPRFSTRLKENDLTEDRMLPQAILITKKKDTPAIWRALSGLFYGRVLCFDMQAHDMSSSIVKRFKVESLPAIVGVLLNGESYVISSGSSLDQASASVEGLQRLLEDLEKKSMKAGPKGGKSEDKVPLLTKKNFERVCGTRSPLCVIAAFKSSNAKLKVKQILETISKKSLVRKGERLDAVENPVSYALLDATKQASFIKALGIRASDIPEASFLIAYKPRKGKFAVYKGSSFNPQDAEDFVVGILSGDVQFKKIGKNPVLID